MNNSLQVITELQPIARRMRERQEEINRGKRDAFARMGDVIASVFEQGQDITLAESKLGKAMTLDDWLSGHCPALNSTEAKRYQRVSKERLTVEQCRFLFTDFNADVKQIETPQRIPPNPRESLWGKIAKLGSAFKAIDLSAWSKTEIDLTRAELEPVAKKLWPERF